MPLSMAARQGPVSALPNQNFGVLNRAPTPPQIEIGRFLRWIVGETRVASASVAFVPVRDVAE
jgi:hypothetical protein